MPCRYNTPVDSAPVTPDYIRFLYDYTYWARDRVLRRAERLSEEDYVRDRGFDHGGLRGTLVHVLSAETVWRNRWQGVSPLAPLTGEDVPTFDALTRLWSLEEAKMRAFIEGLTPPALAREVEYMSTDGSKKYRNPLWEMMVHVVNHAAQHRSEVALALTQLGYSPGDLDMIAFIREKQSENG